MSTLVGHFVPSPREREKRDRRDSRRDERDEQGRKRNSWMRRPTGDQEVAGSTLAEVGNILSWRLIMKYFLWAFFSLPLIQEGQLSVSGERMCTILVNRLED